MKTIKWGSRTGGVKIDGETDESLKFCDGVIDGCLKSNGVEVKHDWDAVYASSAVVSDDIIAKIRADFAEAVEYANTIDRSFDGAL